MTANFFALLVLLSGLAYLGLVMADSRQWYGCAHCGTKNGEHAKDCHFRSKDKDV